MIAMTALSLPETVRVKANRKETQLSRWAVAFATAAVTAILLALLEPALAVSDAERFLLIVTLLALFRSPFWVATFIDNARTDRP